MMRPLLFLTVVVSLARSGFCDEKLLKDKTTVIKDFEFDLKTEVDAAIETAKGGESDNVIDREEFKTAYNKKLAEGRTWDEKELFGLFNLMDVDQNNELTIKEYVQGTIQHQEFKKYDTSGDNQLDEGELLKMFDTPDKVKETIYYDYSNHASFVEFFHRFIAHTKLNIGWQGTLGSKRVFK